MYLYTPVLYQGKLYVYIGHSANNSEYAIIVDKDVRKLVPTNCLTEFILGETELPTMRPNDDTNDNDKNNNDDKDNKDNNDDKDNSSNNDNNNNTNDNILKPYQSYHKLRLRRANPLRFGYF